MEENARVRVDSSAGLVEVEGSEAFVREMLDRFAGVLARTEVKADGKPRGSRKGKGRDGGRPKAEAPREGKARRSKQPQLNEELRKQLNEHLSDLNSYLEERKIESQPEEAALIARFLGSKLGIEAMDDRQYATVLMTLGRELPVSPYQVLKHGVSRNHLFYQDGAAYRLTGNGITFADSDSLKVKQDSGD